MFGPIMDNPGEKFNVKYTFSSKVHYTYKFSFVGKRSKCPGFAMLREKPGGFKRKVKGKTMCVT